MLAKDGAIYCFIRREKEYFRGVGWGLDSTFMRCLKPTTLGRLGTKGMMKLRCDLFLALKSQPKRILPLVEALKKNTKRIFTLIVVERRRKRRRED